MSNLRLVGGTLFERITSQCGVGLHGGMVTNPKRSDLLAKCRICGAEWRQSDIYRPMTAAENVAYFGERP